MRSAEHRHESNRLKTLKLEAHRKKQGDAIDLIMWNQHLSGMDEIQSESVQRSSMLFVTVENFGDIAAKSWT
jgi:hypothetical protein